jgi:hypothetical protein
LEQIGKKTGILFHGRHWSKIKEYFSHVAWEIMMYGFLVLLLREGLIKNLQSLVVEFGVRGCVNSKKICSNPIPNPNQEAHVRGSFDSTHVVSCRVNAVGPSVAQAYESSLA